MSGEVNHGSVKIFNFIGLFTVNTCAEQDTIILFVFLFYVLLQLLGWSGTDDFHIRVQRT